MPHVIDLEALGSLERVGEEEAPPKQIEEEEVPQLKVEQAQSQRRRHPRI